MSREIKFRAWDKRNERMIDAHACAVNFKHYIVDNTLLFVPMQYTGLKDKNGKEICEGDVLENKNCRYLNRAECYFEDGSFQFKASGCNQCDEYLCNNVTREFEVIGSIYENPELLKESKK